MNTFTLHTNYRQNIMLEKRGHLHIPYVRHHYPLLNTNHTESEFFEKNSLKKRFLAFIFTSNPLNPKISKITLCEL